ncbi:hypothetical protein HRbin02_00774 [Candidatus Calditenuaceae archaeon HR02]|nr:hypothetical protein HRbin02_00774 [Candidatus Calditenuaceae archaeon HR02]
MLEGSGTRLDAQQPVIDPHSPPGLAYKIKGLGTLQATAHTPVYTMHKFWARRPWKLFKTLIQQFTSPGDLILDPFAGGGVVLVEGLAERRRVIAVDINPLAALIMRHEVAHLDLGLYERALELLGERVEPLARRLYYIRCLSCGGGAQVHWTEFLSEGGEPIRAFYSCPACGARGEKRPEPGDLPPPPSPPKFERVRIPYGDKTRDLLKRGLRFFDELYTPRNLYIVLKIREAVEEVCAAGSLGPVRSFLLFTLSSTLKWASKMSHLRGRILEGWAMHAYWIYPRHVEVNVWRQFLNRARAVVRGKSYSNSYIGEYSREANSFEDLSRGCTYMVLNQDARRLPIPPSTVDAVITDPPYGDNVNYAELSDYFLWIFGGSSPKEGEVVINRARGSTLQDYCEGLKEVFSECSRVLKPSGLLVSTFNSKDASVVAAFFKALREAGFGFIAASPQPYLKAYQTTFHALQVDSMPFDYVFFFAKDFSCGCRAPSLESFSEGVEGLVRLCVERGWGEREFRVRAYPLLINFLAHGDPAQLYSAAKILEKTVQKERIYFREVRARIIGLRRLGAGLGDTG